MLEALRKYVQNHTERGECHCGKCLDIGNNPEPTGHTVDMVFFKVAPVNDPSLDEFRSLTQATKQGEWVEVDPFDGRDHSYLELGAWIGDQGLAMQYMALGVALGAFTLLSPTALGVDAAMGLDMAGMGFLSIQAKGGKDA